MKPLVLVLLEASDRQRSILETSLGELADLKFYLDIPEADKPQALDDANVVLSASFRNELTSGDYIHLANVGLIQLMSAGANHLPMKDMPSGPIIAGNAGAYAEPMAEHVMAMVLALAKNITVQDRKLRAGEFDHELPSRLLAGMTAGIVGFGGIGREVARLMAAFGIKILALNSSGKTNEPVAFIGTLEDLKRVLQDSDVVVLSLPLTNATRGLIGEVQLGWMRPECILINVARGALIDEKALYEYARTHPKFGAGLDVWAEEPFSDGRFGTRYPLIELPNVLGSPHTSGIVPGVWEEAVRSAAKNIERFVRGQEIVGRIPREQYV